MNSTAYSGSEYKKKKMNLKMLYRFIKTCIRISIEMCLPPKHGAKLYWKKNHRRIGRFFSDFGGQYLKIFWTNLSLPRLTICTTNQSVCRRHQSSGSGSAAHGRILLRGNWQFFSSLSTISNLVQFFYCYEGNFSTTRSVNWNGKWKLQISINLVPQTRK